MSLNFDLTQIADRETNYPPVTDEAGEVIAWNRTTEAMIWSTIGTDIGYLKDEATATEAHRRYVALGYDTDEGALTLADFIGHIGLRTNVINTGKRDFAAKLKRIKAQRIREAEYQAARRAEREARAEVDATTEWLGTAPITA